MNSQATTLYVLHKTNSVKGLFEVAAPVLTVHAFGFEWSVHCTPAVRSVNADAGSVT